MNDKIEELRRRAKRCESIAEQYRHKGDTSGRSHFLGMAKAFRESAELLERDLVTA